MVKHVNEEHGIDARIGQRKFGSIIDLHGNFAPGPFQHIDSVNVEVRICRHNEFRYDSIPATDIECGSFIWQQSLKMISQYSHAAVKNEAGVNLGYGIE
jgi:hypothetical protein